MTTTNGDGVTPGAGGAPPGGGVLPGDDGGTPQADRWPLWEVFVRPRRGLAHQHVGSVRAPDQALALRNARDLYTRRSEGVSIWVVATAGVLASDPDDRGMLFDPAHDKTYRQPTAYPVPEGVRHL